jgi:hypothetical protein
MPTITASMWHCVAFIPRKRLRTFIEATWLRAVGICGRNLLVWVDGTVGAHNFHRFSSPSQSMRVSDPESDVTHT